MISEAVNTSRRIANRKRYKEAEGVVQAMLTVEATILIARVAGFSVETRPTNSGILGHSFYAQGRARPLKIGRC